MARRVLPALLTIVTLLWGTFLLASLGVTQRPFYGSVLLAMGRHAAVLAAAAAILLSGMGIGAGVVRALRLSASDGESWLAAALTGIGLLGTLWLWIAHVRLPSQPVSLALLSAGWISLWRWRFPLPALPRIAPWTWAFIAATLGLSLLEALHPATAFDALLYHLRLPELWLSDSSFYPAPREPHFYYPVLVESLFAIAMQISGENAAQLVHWGALPLTLLLIWQLCRRFFPSVSTGLLWTIALSIQMLPLLASWAYTDLYLACFQVGVVWALLVWRTERSKGWLVLAGICAGAALGVKYLALFTPILAAAMLFNSRGRPRLENLHAVALFAVTTLVVALPSYSRAFIATGNPIFPFLFPSPYWDDFRAAWYAATGTGIGFSLPDLFLLPYTVTVGLGDANYFDGRPGVVVIAFLPLAVLLWAWREPSRTLAGADPERRVTGWLLFFACAYALIWTMGVIGSDALRQGRFLLPVLILLCPVVAWSLTRLSRFDTPALRLSFVARAFVTAGALFTLLVAGADFVNGDPSEALFADPVAWQQQQWGPYAALVSVSHALPPGARLHLWYEPRSYKMATSVVPDTIVAQFAWRMHVSGGALDKVDRALCDDGVTHVALYRRGVNFLSEEGDVNVLSEEMIASLEAWTARHEKMWSDGSGWYELYRLQCLAT